MADMRYPIFAVLAWIVLQSAAPGRAEAEDAVAGAEDFGRGIVSGLEVRDGAITLYMLADDFQGAVKDRYKITMSASAKEDEYGVVDYKASTTYITQQAKPDPSLLVETHDNDHVSLARSVPGTAKGFLELDMWPIRFWPTSGTLTITLSGAGGTMTFPLSASDYKHAMVKDAGGEKLTVPGGRPYFSSFLNSNIYAPNEVIPESERRWRNMRLLFRPAYMAGSLDRSVCREIEDPERREITVDRLTIGVQQLETQIRNLRFKALLGEAISPPLRLTGRSWGEINVDAAAPEKTRIGLQVRGARSERALANAAWEGPSGKEPYFLDVAEVPAGLARQRYLQIRLLLKATADAPFEATPAVRSISVEQKEGR
ncbi:MAG: hypothetical protein JW909_00845 [Planctomycetes bacterium]|nr:hypothetical protein [Planctomycetota bacterium]